MPGKYKVTGIDPGPTAFQLGNYLTIRKSRDVVNTPGMYAKMRGLAMGWMNSAETSKNYIFLRSCLRPTLPSKTWFRNPGSRTTR